MAEYRIPELSLVVLVGASGSGKSTFAAQHFGRFEVISSDFCRGLVADDQNDQAATRDAFDVLGYIAGKRLAAGRLTVIDATNVQADARKPLIELARAHDVLPVAIVLDVPEKTCLQRNASRADRSFGGQVIHRQQDQLRRSVRSLSREGFRVVHVLRGVDEVAAASIVRHRLLTDYTDRAGPFDVHRRRTRLPGRTGGAAGPARLPDHPGRGRAAVRCGTAGGPDRGVPRRPGGPGAGFARRAPAGDGHGRRRAGAGRPGQPREQADPGAVREERPGQPRAGRDAGPAGRRGRGVPPPGRRVLPRAGVAPGAGRRPAGGRARRAEGGVSRPGVRAGAQLRAVRRHHRGDR